MSPLGRWSALGAAALAVMTAATWNQGSTPSSSNAGPDGAQLFRAKGCSSCHTGPDTTASIGGGFPSLADASAWAGDRRANLSAAEYLTESIVAPAVFISPDFQVGRGGPTTAMPQLRLNSQEIDALVEYLLGP